jgi:hypothetical protein
MKLLPKIFKLFLLITGMGWCLLSQAQPVGTVSSKSTSLDAEDQLKAIREAMVEATLGKSIHVFSTAWVDEKGSLHEEAEFQSQSIVKGVRVESYLSKDSKPQQKIHVDVLPVGLKQITQKQTSECIKPGREWKLPVQIYSKIKTGFSGSELFASDYLLKQITSQWKSELDQTTHWIAREIKKPPADAYNQALLGQSKEGPGWLTELELAPVSQEEPSPDLIDKVTQAAQFWKPSPITIRTWRLTLRAGKRESIGSNWKTEWEISEDFRASSIDLGERLRAWAQEQLGGLTTKLQEAVKKFDQQLACEPIRFEVRLGSGGRELFIQLGAGSGIKKGDRFLVLDQIQIPARLMDQGTLQRMTLAEVVDVGNYESLLKPLAGPNPRTAGDWVAFPL